jgi:hypothetical protein
MTIEQANERLALLKDQLADVNFIIVTDEEELVEMESEVEMLLEFINESEHDEFENY